MVCLFFSFFIYWNRISGDSEVIGKKQIDEGDEIKDFFRKYTHILAIV